MCCQVLGKGQFGTTRSVTDKRTGEKLACKSISKRKLISQEDIADVQREVQIMHHLEGEQAMRREWCAAMFTAAMLSAQAC